MVGPGALYGSCAIDVDALVHGLSGSQHAGRRSVRQRGAAICLGQSGFRSGVGSSSLRKYTAFCLDHVDKLRLDLGATSLEFGVRCDGGLVRRVGRRGGQIG